MPYISVHCPVVSVAYRLFSGVGARGSFLASGVSCSPVGSEPLRWWPLELCHELLTGGDLDERHVLLQSFQAFVGTLGGVYAPESIPWELKGPLPDKAWMVHSPPLNNYASFCASNTHGTPKLDQLMRGASYGIAGGEFWRPSTN